MAFDVQVLPNARTTVLPPSNLLMRRGNWKSPTVAEGYVADTNTGSMTIAAMLELKPAPDPDAGHASNKKRSSSPTSHIDASIVPVRMVTR